MIKLISCIMLPNLFMFCMCPNFSDMVSKSCAKIMQSLALHMILQRFNTDGEERCVNGTYQNPKHWAIFWSFLKLKFIFLRLESNLVIACLNHTYNTVWYSLGPGPRANYQAQFIDKRLFLNLNFTKVLLHYNLRII